MALATAPLFSQAPPEIKPVFDVASVKPSLPGSRQQLTIQPGGRLSANEFSLEALIAICHHLAAYQLSGAEGWMKADRWSIEAKAEDVTQIPAWSPPYLPEVMAVRLRALLEGTFFSEGKSRNSGAEGLHADYRQGRVQTGRVRSCFAIGNWTAEFAPAYGRLACRTDASSRFDGRGAGSHHRFSSDDGSDNQLPEQAYGPPRYR